MSDGFDDVLGARLAALAPSVDMAASRALFERERRRPTTVRAGSCSRRRPWC